jgi:hypothetical protein
VTRADKNRKLKRLQEVNEQTPGLPAEAFVALSSLAPKVDGEPVVLGPYDRMDNVVVPTIRTLGFRKASHKDAPPIMHAKLALLGHLWWHDEGAGGNVEDVIGFTPQRLWVSSANFTESSRRSLEWGYWTEEPALLRGAERFLATAMGLSEGVDPDADSWEPDLAPVEFDDEAMAQALAEAQWDDSEDEDTV